jgi:hypothetical protein
MTGDTLLDDLLSRGITLEWLGDNLRVRGPESVVKAVREELRTRKREILAALGQAWARKAAALLAQIHDDDLRADLRYRFEERAAICEYDGGMSRDEAERGAFKEIEAALLSRGPPGDGGASPMI